MWSTAASKRMFCRCSSASRRSSAWTRSRSAVMSSWVQTQEPSERALPPDLHDASAAEDGLRLERLARRERGEPGALADGHLARCPALVIAGGDAREEHLDQRHARPQPRSGRDRRGRRSTRSTAPAGNRRRKGRSRRTCCRGRRRGDDARLAGRPRGDAARCRPRGSPPSRGRGSAGRSARWCARRPCRHRPRATKDRDWPRAASGSSRPGIRCSRRGGFRRRSKARPARGASFPGRCSRAEDRRGGDRPRSRRAVGDPRSTPKRRKACAPAHRRA